MADWSSWCLLAHTAGQRVVTVCGGRHLADDDMTLGTDQVYSVTTIPWLTSHDPHLLLIFDKPPTDRSIFLFTFISNLH